MNETRKAWNPDDWAPGSRRDEWNDWPEGASLTRVPVCTCEFLPGFGVDTEGCEMHAAALSPERA